MWALAGQALKLLTWSLNKMDTAQRDKYMQEVGAKLQAASVTKAEAEMWKRVGMAYAKQGSFEDATKLADSLLSD